VLTALALATSACGVEQGGSSGAGGAAGRSAATTFEFKPLDAGGPVSKEALKRGDVQVAMLSSSDADIVANDWVALEDDKDLQRPENLAPVIRASKVGAPIRKALDAVSKKLSNDQLIELNRQNRVEGLAPKDIAARWLKAQRLLPYRASKASGHLVVGSTTFAEQQIVAELYVQVLASAGVGVSRELQIGDRAAVAAAFEHGDIDLAPDYLGGYTLFVKADATVPSRVDRAASQLRELLAPTGLTVLDPAAAQDTKAFVVTRATAEHYKLSSVSDLAKVRDPLVVAGPPECPKRPFCLVGLKETYGLAFNV
jgi:osmoprotectant transport system substrate-binding protein